ncbi:MAG TPA: CRTAC1 family protein, partial [Blastocatellia bacterium]|nr:CRTAC1 family protein [Blastocatellia bacterium]
FGNYFPDGSRILDSNSDSPEQMQDSMSMALNGGRNRFFLWSAQPILWAGQPLPHDPSALFREAQAALDDDLVCGWTLAVGAADLDGDMLPEVYFANDFGPDRLLHNLSRPGELSFQLLLGQSTISTPKSKVLGRDSFKGMGVDFADLNGDGFLDIYVSNIAKEYALEESHQLFLSTGSPELMKDGIAPYRDHSEPLGLSRSGWGWDVRFGDFNNDGVLESIQATGFLKGQVNRWPELHELAMGNDQLLHSPGSWPRFLPGDDLSGHEHNPFFVRARDGRYYDVAAALGLDQPEVSRGIATADVDGDGRLDFAVANQWDNSYFYHNTSPNPGAFLGLRLLVPLLKEEGETISVGRAAINHMVRPAIGASATVHLPDGKQLVAQVDGGNGHSGKRSPELHFGLGALPPDIPIKVDLRWRGPGGRLSMRTVFLMPGWHTVQLGW